VSYTTITSEGGLIPSDMLDALAKDGLPGQQAADFGLDRSARLSDDIAAAWGDAQVYWEAFQRSVNRLRPSDTGTSATRERWAIPLFELLGYRDISYQPQATIVDDRSFALSHRVGKGELALPIHIESFKTGLDQRPPAGRPRFSPHALMQEYLNRTEHLWAIVCNGEKLRLLRDSSRIARPSYVEFDLRAMLEDEVFHEFVLFYRLVHRSRLPTTVDDAPTCWLERYYQQAIDQGGRVREGLRVGVERALKHLGNGFLHHPDNGVLRERIANGQLLPLDFYRQLLRLVYRLLFLMVAEERNLIVPLSSGQQIPDNNAETQSHRDAERWAMEGEGGDEGKGKGEGGDEGKGEALGDYHVTANGAWVALSPTEALRIYQATYSITRLRRIAEGYGTGKGAYDDMWQGLLITFEVLEGSDEQKAQLLRIVALDGDLFGSEAVRDLISNGTTIYNSALLDAIFALSLYRDPESTYLRRVNYGAIDVEELGSVYESLLDYRPNIIDVDGTLYPSFELVVGTERKTTGSYYTKPELVQELIKSALDPVIDARLQAAAGKLPAKESALLGIRVCDPACGSGHFLLAAARRIGRELARVRSGEDYPTPPMFRHAVREVIAHCIYGVDLNPLAIDLCKLALWIEGHNAGMPLSFLDSHIRLGNSLVGASAETVACGIPDAAFKPVTGDDKTVASTLRKRNKQERTDLATGQQVFLDEGATDTVKATLAAGLVKLEQTPDETVPLIRDKATRYAALRGNAEPLFRLYDLWCAAFFQPFTRKNSSPITTQMLHTHMHTPLPPDHPAALAATTLAHAPALRFFHWELEFPQVFLAQDRAASPGFDVVLGNPPWERIKLQEQEHFIDVPEIGKAPNKAARERVIKAWRTSTEPAKQNRIALFDQAKHQAEATSRFIRTAGQFPLTAVGDMNTYALFAERDRDLMNANGRAGVIVPTGIATDDTTKTFFGDLNSQHQLVSFYDFENREKLFAEVDSRFRFSLLTIGKTKQPTRFVFFATNMLHLEDEQRSFTLTPKELAMINPNTRTCPTFRTQRDAELTKNIYQRVPVLVHEHTGKNPWGVSFMTMLHMSGDSHLFHTEAGEGLLPLYEAKLMHQFTHRWATYGGDTVRELTLEELADPSVTITPRYWVAQEAVAERLAGKWEQEWLLGFRDICRSTDERTAIFSLLPLAGVGHKIPLVFLGVDSALLAGCFLACVNSLPFDFVARQKIGGLSLSYFILKQLPVLSPSAFSAEDIAYIVPRVVELVYTAWDMRPFAADVWAEWQPGAEVPAPYVWDGERRAVVRAELDARIARLYGLTREELRYILDPAEVYGAEFPGETFRVLKEKEQRVYGEYRTRRLVLAAWDAAGG
jgi:hypothetical protein